MNEDSQERALADHEDITYEIDQAAAVITINRPERYNTFRGKTVEELIKAFRAAWADQRVSAATFGQAGPRVGSFDAGFGSAYLARVVGEKRAREYLCRRYDAATAERWGLVNYVVPTEKLMAEAKAIAAEIAAKSPTALRFLKQSFNADTDHQAGLSNLAMSALEIFVHTDEGMEGARAFAEKRTPDFARYVTA
jgi:1,4-dihydroxy-2-naphthoyl-CoA synthase